MTSQSFGDIVDNTSAGRFEMTVGPATAFIVYRPGKDGLQLIHAEVPTELEGRGVGSELVKRTFALLRARGQKARPVCSFIRAYAGRHSEFADILV